jgi:hypothetical protein
MIKRPPAELTKWTTPDSYFGHNPVGDYVIATRHRDSSILADSNFELTEKRIDEALGENTHDQDDEAYCYSFTTNHWAVGWIQYLILRADAPAAGIDEARKIKRKLEDYPILDEDDYSNREYEAACKSWEESSLRDRIYECSRDGISIFAARRDELPESNTGELIGHLSGEIR